MLLWFSWPSLVAGDAEHLFMHLLAICIFFLFYPQDLHFFFRSSLPYSF